jgi:enoyl-CoA hydratase/carnithine racemase
MIDEQMAVELLDALKGQEASPDVDVIVLAGAGECFCAGADAASVRRSGRAEEFAQAVGDLFGFFPGSPKPIVGAVRGDALAGGFGLLCSCDVVVLGAGAEVGTIEAQFGAWPMIAQVPVTRRVPEKAALVNILTGEPFSAERALALGVVDEVVAVGHVHDRAEHWARKIAVSGAACAVGRPLFFQSRDQDYMQALKGAQGAFARSFTIPAEQGS